MNETKPNPVVDRLAKGCKLAFVAKKMLNVEQVRALLKKQQGSRSASDLARELGVSPSYISEIYQGRRDPGDKVLSKLNLQRRIVYEQVA